MQSSTIRSPLSAQRSSSAACFTTRRPLTRQVLAKAQAEGEATRRESFVGVASVLAATTLLTRPATAGLLGLDDKEKEDEYKQLTLEVIGDVNKAFALPKDDPGRPDAIQKIRDETTNWVAKYRRDAAFQGRASYSNTYSALSALAGHYNSFGPETNVPKKRLDRLTKELNDAEKFVTRGR